MHDTDHKKSKGRWKSWLGNLAILLVGYVAIQAFHSRDIPTGHMPEIRGTLLNGDTVSLQQYRGQAVLVYFWASWCSICKFQQSYVDDIAKDHAVITIASQSGSAEKIRQHVQQRHISAPVLADIGDRYQKEFGVKGFPTSIIVDADGNISDVEVGITSEWGLRARLWWAGR